LLQVQHQGHDHDGRVSDVFELWGVEVWVSMVSIRKRITFMERDQWIEA